MKLIFADTETTGRDESAKIVQIAALEVAFPEGLLGPMLPMKEQFFNPGIEIPPEAMEVHHITNERVKNEPSLAASVGQYSAYFSSGIFVAHNAPFDIQMLAQEGIKKPEKWIDTLRVCRHLYPDQKFHRLGFLRYSMQLQMISSEINPHDAASDVYMLHALFTRIYDEFGPKYSTPEEFFDMIAELSVKPVLLKTAAFGKHAGTEWAKVPRDYLRWLLDNPQEGKTPDPDLVYTWKFHLGMMNI